MADTQEATELLPTEETQQAPTETPGNDAEAEADAPMEDVDATATATATETAETQAETIEEIQPVAEAEAETQAEEPTAETEAAAATDENGDADADADTATEEPMPDVTAELEAEADAEAAGDAEGRTAVADEAVEQDQGPPEHRKLRQAIREIMAASDMDKLTASDIRSKLKTQFDKKYIKEQKAYIKQFVVEEIKKLQDEGGGGEDEAEEAPEGEAEGEFEGVGAEEAEEGEELHDSDYEKPAPRTKKSSKAKKIRKRSTRDDDDEDEDEKPSKKRKKTVKIQGPSGPKAAFFIFAADYRDAIREEFPDASTKEINQKLGERWKQASAAERAEYEKKAKQDQQRYTAEMRALKESNPEQYELLLKQKAAAKNKKGKGKKGSGDESGDESGGEGKEGKPMSFLDSILNDLKTKRPKAQNDEKTNRDNCSAFVDRMGKAADNDIDLHDQKQPAINKLRMLDDVIATCSKVRMHEYLMSAGLLGTIRLWLQPLDDGHVLPNIRIRSSLYKILDMLPVDDHSLSNSQGLGKLMMELWKHPDETPENKKVIAAILEKWMRPIARTETNYKHLAKYEEQRAYEIRERREIMAAKKPLPYLATKRARIPEPATFDYAIRPQAAINNRDREEMQDEDDAAKAAAKAQTESRRGQLMKKLDNSRKKNAGKTNFKVDIEGRRMAV